MSKSRSNEKSSESTVYHLRAEHEGMTLSAVLKEFIEGSSWGQVKKWISNRQVQVNGNLCLDEARRVSETNVIKFWQQPLAKPVDRQDIRIAHLDDHLLVIEKPAGITSVRHVAERKLSTRRRQLQPTLEEMLPPLLAKVQKLRWPPLPPIGMNRGRQQTNRKRGQQQPGHILNSKKLPPELEVFPVHRLDRDTSGLMLFARTRAAELKLVGMFRRHTVQRDYVGFCLGTPDVQTIRSSLVRDRGDGIRGSLPSDANEELTASAQSAVTHITSVEPILSQRGDLENQPTYSKIRCKLETGRTHQIRIHLSEAGHMLCGDKIYVRNADGSTTPDPSGAPRHALHSDSLTFTHPFSGQHMTFHMPLPKDLSAWLKRLK